MLKTNVLHVVSSLLAYFFLYCSVVIALTGELTSLTSSMLLVFINFLVDETSLPPKRKFPHSFPYKVISILACSGDPIKHQ